MIIAIKYYIYKVRLKFRKKNDNDKPRFIY